MALHKNFENVIKKIGGVVLSEGDRFYKLVKGDAEVWVQVVANINEQYLLQIIEKDAIADKEPRNLARGTAFFIVANYIVAMGKTPSESQADGLQKALQSNLLVNAPFQAKTSRQGQELYETLIIRGYLPLYGVKDGEEKNNPKQIAIFRDFARQVLKTVVGVTPEEMTFTNTGVVFK